MAYNEQWHNDDCIRSRENLQRSNGYRSFFCLTHGQWAAEIPLKQKVIFTYQDDSKEEYEINLIKPIT